MTPAKLRLAEASMGKPETNISDLCKELGITCQTPYRYAPQWIVGRGRREVTEKHIAFVD